MEEEQPKRKYNKAKENDRRRETSKLNMAKARQKKLELLSLGKELQKKKSMERYQNPESSDSSESSDSDDSDVIVIAPRKKKHEIKKEKKQEVKKEKKRRSVTKKQVIKIVNPAPEKAPAPVSDSKEDFFTRTLLSMYK